MEQWAQNIDDEGTEKFYGSYKIHGIFYMIQVKQQLKESTVLNTLDSHPYIMDIYYLNLNHIELSKMMMSLKYSKVIIQNLWQGLS